MVSLMNVDWVALHHDMANNHDEYRELESPIGAREQAVNLTYGTPSEVRKGKRVGGKWDGCSKKVSPHSLETL